MTNPTTNKEYAANITLREYFFSFSYRAGEMNLNSSYRMKGEDSKMPTYRDMDIWARNWLGRSVAISSIDVLYTLLSIPNKANVLLTALKVMKSEEHGAKSKSNTSFLKKNTTKAKTKESAHIRKSIFRSASRCSPNVCILSSSTLFTYYLPLAIEPRLRLGRFPSCRQAHPHSSLF